MKEFCQLFIFVNICQHFASIEIEPGFCPRRIPGCHQNLKKNVFFFLQQNYLHRHAFLFFLFSYHRRNHRHSPPPPDSHRPCSSRHLQGNIHQATHLMDKSIACYEQYLCSTVMFPEIIYPRPSHIGLQVKSAGIKSHLLLLFLLSCHCRLSSDPPAMLRTRSSI